jgi:DNA-binding MarR family transcriptional regulator
LTAVPPLSLDAAVTQVQFAYPQIYYACHTRHDRRRSNAVHLSARDAQILVHLDVDVARPVSSLAFHMDLAASTVSEALTRLETLGFVHKAANSSDKRQVGVRLTAKGVAAVRDGSVLESDRLRRVLARMSPSDRRAVVSGLARLARACGPVIRTKRSTDAKRSAHA